MSDLHDTASDVRRHVSMMSHKSDENIAAALTIIANALDALQQRLNTLAFKDIDPSTTKSIRT